MARDGASGSPLGKTASNFPVIPIALSLDVGSAAAWGRTCDQIRSVPAQGARSRWLSRPVMPPLCRRRCHGGRQKQREAAFWPAGRLRLAGFTYQGSRSTLISSAVMAHACRAPPRCAPTRLSNPPKSAPVRIAGSSRLCRRRMRLIMSDAEHAPSLPLSADQMRCLSVFVAEGTGQAGVLGAAA
jgi:hypothetical protein